MKWPAPMLGDGPYADRPTPRSNDWGKLARLPDIRIARAEDAAAEGGEDGGMQQERHPGLPEEGRAESIELEQALLPGIGDDEDDVAADKRAMDQARGLTPVARGYGLNESGKRDLLTLGIGE